MSDPFKIEDPLKDVHYNSSMNDLIKAMDVQKPRTPIYTHAHTQNIQHVEDVNNFNLCFGGGDHKITFHQNGTIEFNPLTLAQTSKMFVDFISNQWFNLMEEKKIEARKYTFYKLNQKLSEMKYPGEDEKSVIINDLIDGLCDWFRKELL